METAYTLDLNPYASHIESFSKVNVKAKYLLHASQQKSGRNKLHNSMSSFGNIHSLFSQTPEKSALLVKKLKK